MKSFAGAEHCPDLALDVEQDFGGMTALIGVARSSWQVAVVSERPAEYYPQVVGFVSKRLWTGAFELAGPGRQAPAQSHCTRTSNRPRLIEGLVQPLCPIVSTADAFQSGRQYATVPDLVVTTEVFH